MGSTRAWRCAQLSLLLSTLLSFPHRPPTMAADAAATSHNNNSNSNSNYDVHRLPVPKFELVSRSSNSIVVRMINAEMVARLEMKITIYDLDRLREFRQSEFTAAHYRDQLFSFAGLTPETWFAVRIEYRFLYNKLMTRRSNTSTPALYAISKLGNFPTKQELIVRTKSDSLVANAKLHADQSAVTEDVGVKDILLRRLNTSAVERAVLHNTANSSAQANGDYYALLLAFETGFPLRPKGLQAATQCQLGDYPPDWGPPLLPNFDSLRDLLLQRQQDTRAASQLVVALNASNYQWIPDSFLLPCPVAFVAIADEKSQLDARLLADFEAVSKRCGNQDRPDAKPLALYSNDGIASIVTSLAKIITGGEGTLLLTIASDYSLNVSLTPRLPRQLSVGPHAEAIALDKSGKATGNVRQVCHLIGFARANQLLHLPSTSTLHHVAACTEGEGGENSFRGVQFLAEGMGQESQVGVFQHQPTGAICVLRPIREDVPTPSATQPAPEGANKNRWQLCLQFIPAESFRFHFNQSPEAVCNSVNPKKILAEERAASYRATSQRTYWTDAHGIQSDIMKLNRLLKKPDRTELFHAEVSRIAHYAIACGYHAFAPTFADLLERRCTVIADENRDALVTVLQTIRRGGFSALRHEGAKTK